MRVCSKSMAWLPSTSTAKNSADVTMTPMSCSIMPLSVIRWITRGCKKPITVDSTSVRPTTTKAFL